MPMHSSDLTELTYNPSACSAPAGTYAEYPQRTSVIVVQSPLQRLQVSLHAVVLP